MANGSPESVGSLKGELMSSSPLSTPTPASATRSFSSSMSHSATWMRLTARFLLAGWLLPVLFAFIAAFSTTPAQAQNPALQTVVVLDFAVAPGLDPLLGRKAGDALAVELQRSGQYEVVPRARVEEAVAQQAGLQPPYNDTAQIRLAQAVNARSVFSGRISKVNLTPGRSAQVTIDVRQLDVATGDYLNGTQVTETTEQKLQEVANEVLVDEGLNKAAFSAVRSMRQTRLPVGVVLNITATDVELSIGARNGVAVGQRYTILRDVYDKARDVTERLKIGEVTITKVEADQATARLSAGGASGVNTGDRVRQIFVPTTYPTTSANAGTSITPVTAPVKRVSNKPGAGAGLLGLLGLAALVGLAGFGGGGSGNGSTNVGDIRENNPAGANPSAVFTYSAGTRGLFSTTGPISDATVAYVIYRGETENFVPDIDNIIDVVDARTNNSTAQRTYIDNGGDGIYKVEVKSSGATTGTGGNNSDSGFSYSQTFVSATGAISLTESTNTITLQYAEQPLVIGQQYFYKVGRIRAERLRASSTTGTPGANATPTPSSGSSSGGINILPFTQPTNNNSTGQYTPLYRPVIVNNSGDVSNFSVQLSSQDLTNPLFYIEPDDQSVGTGADQFRVEVSTTTNFAPANTFAQNVANPGATSGFGGDVVLNLGPITIPSTNAVPYVPGETPLYVRVFSRNSGDADNTFRRVSPTVGPFTSTSSSTVNTLSTSRFLNSANTEGEGVNVGRSRGGLGISSTGGGAPRVLKPR